MEDFKRISRLVFQFSHELMKLYSLLYFFDVTEDMKITNAFEDLQSAMRKFRRAVLEHHDNIASKNTKNSDDK